MFWFLALLLAILHLANWFFTIEKPEQAQEEKKSLPRVGTPQRELLKRILKPGYHTEYVNCMTSGVPRVTAMFSPCWVCHPGGKLRRIWSEGEEEEYFHIGAFSLHAECVDELLTPFFRQRFMLLYRCELPVDILCQIFYWMNRCCREKLEVRTSHPYDFPLTRFVQVNYEGTRRRLNPSRG
jgi:hypothetical protein